MCLAVPGKILSVSGEGPYSRLGKVSFGGVVRDVNLSCVPEAEVGNYVIVHVGMALNVLDEAEAHEVFDALKELGIEGLEAV